MNNLALRTDSDIFIVGGQSPHMLGPVCDDWAAIDVWLESVAANSANGSQETVKTYRYHIAKLRWFCENEIGAPPSRWTLQEVLAFGSFLEQLPERALCARAGPTEKHRFVAKGEVGYTPFRKIPSAGSRADIIRCVHAMFNTFHEAGYIRRNPMQRIRARKPRRINTSRALDPDLYDLVLQQMAVASTTDASAHRLNARDRFALVALREIGLRASELVGARMGDVCRLSDPKNGKTYWLFAVREENAKGGVARTVPFTQAAMVAFMAYRKAFGLSAIPTEADQTPILLSPRTRQLVIANKPVKEAQSRRFFGEWSSISSRKSLYYVVKSRLGFTAVSLRAQGRHDDADALIRASPHWLRHTFAKASLLQGYDVRIVSALLGHASVTTTMIYTDQGALDLIRAYEHERVGKVAQD